MPFDDVIHISASQLALYLDCRLRWRLSREAGYGKSTGPQLVGLAGHEVMADYHGLAVTERGKAELEGLVVAHALPDQRLNREMTKCVRQFWGEFGLDEDEQPTGIEQAHRVLLYDDVWLVGAFDSETILSDTGFISEYKFSMKEPDIDDKVWWNHQPLVYYYMAEKLWPDVRLTHSQHTLIWPQGATRIRRPAYLPPEWRDYIPYLAREMLEVSPPIPKYGWGCKRCPFKQSCMRKLKQGTDEKEGQIPVWLLEDVRIGRTD